MPFNPKTFVILMIFFQAHAKALEARNAQLVAQNERLVAENKRLLSDANAREGQEANGPLVVRQPPESAAGTGLSSLGRWTTGLNSLTGDSLEVVVECNQGQQTTEKVTNQEEGPLADVMGEILQSEDFDITNEQDSKACEQILDNILEFSSNHDTTDSTSVSSNDATILDTAWEETFGDLFPDLGECTFWRPAMIDRILKLIRVSSTNILY